MSTTATVDTNEGWTFAGCSHTYEFPTTTEPNNEATELPLHNEPLPARGIAATTTDGWQAPPAAPSPPMCVIGQPRTNDHASLHRTACYEDYCNTHRQRKDNNYYPCQSRRRRQATNCDCPLQHLNELLEVTHERHLNPVKAYADWHWGKRVCPECRFLVNMENNHLHCSAAAPRDSLADITTPQEDQENIVALEGVTADDAACATTPAALRDEQISLLHDIVTMLHHTTTRDAPATTSYTERSTSE